MGLRQLLLSLHGTCSCIPLTRTAPGCTPHSSSISISFQLTSAPRSQTCYGTRYSTPSSDRGIPLHDPRASPWDTDLPSPWYRFLRENRSLVPPVLARRSRPNAHSDNCILAVVFATTLDAHTVILTCPQMYDQERRPPPCRSSPMNGLALLVHDVSGPPSPAR